MGSDPFQQAIDAAATAVRSELIRLGYVEGVDDPDEEDRAIALVAARAFLASLTGIPDV